MSFNFIAAVMICSGFGAPKDKHNDCKAQEHRVYGESGSECGEGSQEIHGRDMTFLIGQP